MKNAPQVRHPLKSRVDMVIGSLKLYSGIIQRGRNLNSEDLWGAHTLGHGLLLRMREPWKRGPWIWPKKKKSLKGVLSLRDGDPGQAQERRCINKAQRGRWVELSPKWPLEKQPQSLFQEGTVIQNFRINAHRASWGVRLGEQDGTEKANCEPTLANSVLELNCASLLHYPLCLPCGGNEPPARNLQRMRNRKKGLGGFGKGQRMSRNERYIDWTVNKASRDFWQQKGQERRGGAGEEAQPQGRGRCPCEALRWRKSWSWCQKLLCGVLLWDPGLCRPRGDFREEPREPAPVRSRGRRWAWCGCGGAAEDPRGPSRGWPSWDSGTQARGPGHYPPAASSHQGGGGMSQRAAFKGSLQKRTPLWAFGMSQQF